MEYLFSSVFHLFAVLVILVGISQVPGVDGRAAVKSGEQKDAVYRLKVQIFSLDEKNKSLSTLNQFELDDIYQEYSLQENCAKPRDCAEVKCWGAWRSGVYKIYPFGVGTGYYVYCYLVEDQDGWTVIQRRLDGSVDFNRNWADYERGFGQLDGEFWLGLTKVHGLLSQRPHELLVKMRDFAGGLAYAKYDWFFVSGPADKYRLQVGHYTGTAEENCDLQCALCELDAFLEEVACTNDHRMCTVRKDKHHYSDTINYAPNSSGVMRACRPM